MTSLAPSPLRFFILFPPRTLWRPSAMPTREIQHREDSQLFAQLCLALLREGHSVQFRVQGESMRPNILDGDVVLVAPAADRGLLPGDIALVQNQDGLRVHRVASCDASSGAVVTHSDTGLDPDPSALRLFGKVVVLRRNSREESLTPLQTRFVHPLRVILHRTRAAAMLRLRRLALFLSGIVAVTLISATFLAHVALAQADLQLTQTASATTVAANQSLGTATTATWAANIASFTFPTPLPTNAVVGALLTTTAFVPAGYNVTNASLLTVNAGTGVITVALVGNPGASPATTRGTGSVAFTQSLGAATAATWAAGIASFTFPAPLPASAVLGALLTTTGFTPAAYNVTNGTILTANSATGVITVAIAANPGASTVRGTGTATLGYTYSEVVANNGPNAVANAADSIVVYMQTPANTVYEGYVGTSWTCVNGTGGVPAGGYTGPLICTYAATLASGTSTSTLTISLQVNAGTFAG